MAPPSVLKKRKVQLPANEHQGQALSAAYRGVCLAKLPFRTPRDLTRIRGVEDWVVDVMEDSFPKDTPEKTGKKGKRTKPYVPRINSAPYAIVITLYREMMKGKDFMLRQDLIDAAEASGLSERGIGPNNYKAKQVTSSKDLYTGWNGMKTLLDNKLVTKWSDPAK